MIDGRGVGVALFSRELRTPAPRNCGSWNVLAISAVQLFGIRK